MCKPLKLALTALKQALQSYHSEIIVMDNASVDHSVEMIKDEFPLVKLSVSSKRAGFSKLANQGIRQSSGQYVLLLHPSVITGEEAIQKIIDFMEAHPYTGGLSVRMLDAEGHFIPESRRSMPKDWISFFRYTGLSRLFAKSRLFSPHYNAGWIEEFENTETDVLNGCFMLLRRQVLNQIKLFDERFTGYGYDIDLSYRIRLAGFNNYYYAKTFVLQQHLPQPSKLSTRYIKNFYGSMLIFAIKYLFRMPELRLKAMPKWYSAAYELKQ